MVDLAEICKSGDGRVHSWTSVEGGVYALVLRLPETRLMRIGQLGTFLFEQGWYVYLGSAHGAGGVMGRTDVHARSEAERRKLWNIDWFRAFADLIEIWFAHLPQQWECRWARTVPRMLGAAMPADNFGAHCGAKGKRRCIAHFFRFPHRPRTSAFRTLLAAGYKEQHGPVYVQFVAPHSSEPISAFGDANTLAAAYERGRRCVELRRRACYDGHEQNPSLVPAMDFQQDRIARIIVAQMAGKMGIGEQELRANARFAAAVDRLVTVCGDAAALVLLDSHCPLTAEAVIRLSRDPEAQQQKRIDTLLTARYDLRTS